MWRDTTVLPDLEEILIESGHWCVYEKPGEAIEAITEFLEKRF